MLESLGIASILSLKSCKASKVNNSLFNSGSNSQDRGYLLVEQTLNGIYQGLFFFFFKSTIAIWKY